MVTLRLQSTINSKILNEMLNYLLNLQIRMHQIWATSLREYQ